MLQRLWNGHSNRLNRKKPSPYSSFQQRMIANMIDAAIMLILLMMIHYMFQPYLFIPDVLLHEVMHDFDVLPDGSLSPEIRQAIWNDHRIRAHFQSVSPQLLAMQLLQLMLVFGFYLGFWWWRQATPGKMMMGLRIVNAHHPDTPLLFWHYLWRFFMIVPSVLCFFLGVFWALGNKQRRMWHDYAAKTLVIEWRYRHMLQSSERVSDALSLPQQT